MAYQASTGSSSVVRLFHINGVLILTALLWSCVLAVAASPVLQFQSVSAFSPHISPDDKLLAERQDNVVTLWDRAGRKLRTWTVANVPQTSFLGFDICFPESGDTIATYDERAHVISLWDTATGTLRTQTKINPANAVACVDGGGLYAKKRDVGSQTYQFVPISDSGVTKRPTISVLAEHPRLIPISGNKFIAVADQVNVGEVAPPRATLRMFDFSTGDLLYEVTDLLTYVLQRADAISISQDGRFVAYVETSRWPGATPSSAKVPGQVIVINVSDRKPRRLNSLKSIQAVSTAFVNKGAWLMVAGEDPDWIQIIDIETDRVVKRLNGRVTAIDPSNGQKLVLATAHTALQQILALPDYSLVAKVGQQTADVNVVLPKASDRLYLVSANRLRDISLSGAARGLDLEIAGQFAIIDAATNRIAYATSVGEGGVPARLRLRVADGSESDVRLPKGDLFFGGLFIPSGKLLVIGSSPSDVMKFAKLAEQDRDRFGANEAGKYLSQMRWRAYLISDTGDVEKLPGERVGMPTDQQISPDGQHLWITTHDGEMRSLALPSLAPGVNPPSWLKGFNAKLSDDGTALVAQSDKRVVVWDLRTGSLLAREFVGQSISGHSPAHHKAVWITMGRELHRWSYETPAKTFSPPSGAVVAEDLSRYAVVTSRNTQIVSSSGTREISLNRTDCQAPIRFSPDGQFLLCRNSPKKAFQHKYAVVDAATGELRVSVSHDKLHRGLPAFSADAGTLFFVDSDTGAVTWPPKWPPKRNLVALDIITRQEIIVTDIPWGQDATNFATSKDNGLVAFSLQRIGVEPGTREVYPLVTGSGSELDPGAASPLGKYELNTVEIFGRHKDSYSFVSRYASPSSIYSLGFSPQGEHIAVASETDTTLLEPRSAKVVRRLPLVGQGARQVGFGGFGHSSQPGQELIYESDVPLSGVGQINEDSLVLVRDDGVLVLFDLRKREVRGYISVSSGGQWAVATVDGRFEVSSFDDVVSMHWIMPDDPLHALPLEIFMRDYYEPRLLPRVLAGEKLPDLRSLADLNRAQPKVEIKEVRVEDQEGGLVAVTVEVASNVLDIRREGERVEMQSGAYDLRVFRDGQLVAQLPQLTEDASPGEQTREEELAKWRRSREIKLDPQTGKTTVTFHGIRLPRKAGLKEVEFSAYAFNVDRVKSATARDKLEVPQALTPRQGRAYVLTIGVNGFEGDAMSRLSYAANDAKGLSTELSQRLRIVKDPDTGKLLFGDSQVVAITLVTEFGTGDQADKLVINQATKDRIKAVVEKLAGKPVDASRLAGIENADQLQAARPEDLVLITFSTHGDTDKRGQFYLMPYDLGASTEETDIRKRAISSEEFSAWLQALDAGELVMIVDACHSAASVESGEFKPGPMGSRGLGQLAFDKGMRILAASQRNEYALETEKTRQGLLSYALVQEGLRGNAANFKPKDARIQLSEWLSYGAERVPGLYRDYGEGKLRVRTATPLDEPFISRQHPALFDFARGRDMPLAVGIGQ